MLYSHPFSWAAITSCFLKAYCKYTPEGWLKPGIVKLAEKKIIYFFPYICNSAHEMIEIPESEIQLRSQDNVTYRVRLWAQDLLLYRGVAFGTSGLGKKLLFLNIICEKSLQICKECLSRTSHSGLSFCNQKGCRADASSQKELSATHR